MGKERRKSIELGVNEQALPLTQNMLAYSHFLCLSICFSSIFFFVSISLRAPHYHLLLYGSPPTDASQIPLILLL